VCTHRVYYMHYTYITYITVLPRGCAIVLLKRAGRLMYIAGAQYGGNDSDGDEKPIDREEL